MKKTGSYQVVAVKHIKFDSIAGHYTAKKAKKTVNTLWAVVGKTPGVPFKQQLVHRLYIDGAPDQGEVVVAAQIFSLAFTELKILEAYP